MRQLHTHEAPDMIKRQSGDEMETPDALEPFAMDGIQFAGASDFKLVMAEESKIVILTSLGNVGLAIPFNPITARELGLTLIRMADIAQSAVNQAASEALQKAARK